MLDVALPLHATADAARGATSLPHNAVWQDIDDIGATGAEGIGLWERKLPDGTDTDVGASRRRRCRLGNLLSPLSAETSNIPNMPDL
jgi:hypothetical protein